MPQSGNGEFKEIVFDTLFQRRGVGITQRELEMLYGYSKSYISDVLGQLEAKGLIVRKEEWGNTKRVWASEYYPHFRTGILRVGTLKSTEYIPFLSFLTNFCLQAGYTTRIIPYDDLHSLMNDQCSGLLEITCAPLLAQIMFSMLNGNISIGGFLASGGSCILENMKSRAESYATTESSSMILITRRFLSKHEGLKVTPFIDPFKATEAFLRGDHKYISIWEPFASLILMRSENVSKITSFKEMLGDLPCCSFAFSREFLLRDKQTVSSIKTGYEKYDKTVFSDDEVLSISQALSLSDVELDILSQSLRNYNFNITFSKEVLDEYLDKALLPFTESAILNVFI
jgi:predicted transcriptional regulator